MDSDHPGFTDPVYRLRRKELSDISRHYKHGQTIPRVDYMPAEIETWRTVFRSLVKMYPTRACRQFNQNFSNMVDKGIFREDAIPQLQDISDFLKDSTGFQIRPAAGFLPFREFLAGLAFRVIRATQYVRHSSKPMFTPEPDLIHELLGHVPMLADPDFAQFTQEIGLASLGASDEDMKKLASLLWFTVEFGICREEGQLKAYGAALLSSYGELEHSFSGRPELRPLELEEVCSQDYPVTRVQPVYFVADSFDDFKVKFRKFISEISRPFNVRYNPFTQSVEVINKKDHMMNLTKAIKGDLSLIEKALADANK